MTATPNSKRVLVVDDSSTIRGAIRRMLVPRGYAVDEAGDGAQALAQVLKNGDYVVILCDIDMPVMDGLTFVSTLRGTAGAAQPPIVMCSTHNSFEKITDALSRGANEFIMKPFDADIIEEKLAACEAA
jgi:two-component system chemotaxis response regulator CheY